MALPATLNPSSPANTDSPASGDDQIRALKQLIADLFGFPTDPTSLTAAPFAISAGGVVTVSQNNLVFQAGTVTAPAFCTSGDTNTGVYFSAADTFDITCGGVRAAQFVTAGTGVNYFKFTPSAAGSALQIDAAGSDTDIGINYDTKGAGVHTFRSAAGSTTLLALSPASNVSLTLTGADAGVNGPSLSLVHTSASPANADNAGLIEFNAKDGGGTQRIVGRITVEHTDITAASQDSRILFSVMNAVNAGDINTIAELTSLGVWTDASAAASKKYIGDVDGVLDKLKKLKTLGVYVGANVAGPKLATAERHYSPTAEEFFATFGLGNNPEKGTPGIAPKDVAWLAIKAALEIDARVTALEAK